eukprot:1190795-Pyramimonas_sp.AAC.1
MGDVSIFAAAPFAEARGGTLAAAVRPDAGASFPRTSRSRRMRPRGSRRSILPSQRRQAGLPY